MNYSTFQHFVEHNFPFLNICFFAKTPSESLKHLQNRYQKLYILAEFETHSYEIQRVLAIF